MTKPRAQAKERKPSKPKSRKPVRSQTDEPQAVDESTAVGAREDGRQDGQRSPRGAR